MPCGRCRLHTHAMQPAPLHVAGARHGWSHVPPHSRHPPQATQPLATGVAITTRTSHPPAPSSAPQHATLKTANEERTRKVQVAQQRLKQTEGLYKADRQAFEEAQARAQAECPVDSRLQAKFAVGGYGCTGSVCWECVLGACELSVLCDLCRSPCYQTVPCSFCLASAMHRVLPERHAEPSPCTRGCVLSY
jgi:hypothetical protein